MIQIYTGEGKGKTTASVGLSIRASKHFKVLFIQFIKDGSSSEIGGLEGNKNIETKSFGSGSWILSENDRNKEKQRAKEAIKYIAKNYDKYDVIVMDEVVTAVDLGVISEQDVLKMLDLIPKDKEVVMTGRGATKRLIEKADLVTEMKNIKHYYSNGIKARKGIEL